MIDKIRKVVIKAEIRYIAVAGIAKGNKTVGKCYLHQVDFIIPLSEAAQNK